MPEFGLVQVYTGSGKDKTSIGFGLAFRACRHGFKVCILQFRSGADVSSELTNEKLLPGIMLFKAGEICQEGLKNSEGIDAKGRKKAGN